MEMYQDKNADINTRKIMSQNYQTEMLRIYSCFSYFGFKLGEFIKLVELDICFIDSGVYCLWICFIDSGVYCLWIVFFAHMV